MEKNNIILSLKSFKMISLERFKQGSFEKLGHARESFAKELGFDCYRAYLKSFEKYWNVLSANVTKIINSHKKENKPIPIILSIDTNYDYIDMIKDLYKKDFEYFKSFNEEELFRTGRKISNMSVYDICTKQEYEYKYNINIKGNSTYLPLDEYGEHIQTFQNEIPGVSVVSFEEFSKMEKDRIFSQASKVNTYFKPYHKFSNQVLIEGVAYNPKLPSNFWSNPNEDRDYEELQDWWDKAFIVSNNGSFIVYRLDGGAWDRPTIKGTFDKLEDALELAQSLNNIKIINKNKCITLSTGAVVDVSGLFINSKGNRLSADAVSNELNMLQIEKAKRFIESVMEKRETINKSEGTSYSLKHRVEEFLYFYFKDENNYISNGEMIAALDSCGYKIKEIPSSPNIYTNFKTLKDFTSKLAKNEYLTQSKKFK